MRTLKRITSSLTQLSRALAPISITTDHCKRCDRETRWMVNLAHGYFRCLECDTAPEEKTPSKQDKAHHRA